MRELEKFLKSYLKIPGRRLANVKTILKTDLDPIHTFVEFEFDDHFRSMLVVFDSIDKNYKVQLNLSQDNNSMIIMRNLAMKIRDLDYEVLLVDESLKEIQIPVEFCGISLVD